MDLDDGAKLWTWGLCKLGSYKFLNVVERELGWLTSYTGIGHECIFKIDQKQSQNHGYRRRR